MTNTEKIKQLVARAMDLVDEFNEVLPNLDDVGNHLVHELIYVVSNMDELEEYLVENKR